MTQQSKGVLVTGVSSGIGLETAVHLARAGFRVVGTVRDLARSSPLQQAAARHNVSVHIIAMDVADVRSVATGVEQALEITGGLYGLVNNAGTILRGYFEDVSDEEMRKLFDTNVFGTMTVTRTVLPHLRAARRGRIVIMSSTGGKLATPGNSAYCASKFALEGFGEALRQELVPFGIGVSLIEPGFIRTELFGKNRHVATRALRPDSPYRSFFEKLEELTDAQVRGAVTPAAAVAVAVQHALEARQPRLHYIVGNRARFLLGLRRYLPGETFDRLWVPEITRRLNPDRGVNS
jgi:NAD(P)-dependent dehydrogenase (short-subunit alcohol dehydrogenase family)